MIENIEKLTSDKVIWSIDQLGEWFLCSAYLVNWLSSKYVVRRAKNNMSWYEYPNDIFRSFSISHIMFCNTYHINPVKSYWVFEFEWEIYHVMDFVNWDIKQLNEYSTDDIINTSTKIAQIHSIKYTWNNKKEIYARSLREAFSNHETILSLYEQSIWLENSNLIKTLKKSFDEYLYLTQLNKERSCVSLHWDFWYNNIIFNKDKVCLIDFSRIPYWEAWIDIWHFLANLQIEYVITWNEVFKNHYNLFLENYIKVSGDKNIAKYIKLSKLLVLWICLSPKIQWFLNWNEEQIDQLIISFDWSFS